MLEKFRTGQEFELIGDFQIRIIKSGRVRIDFSDNDRVFLTKYQSLFTRIHIGFDSLIYSFWLK